MGNCQDSNYYYYSRGCINGYNYAKNICCDVFWVDFGWFMLAFFVCCMLICILCMMKRKRMQQ